MAEATSDLPPTEPYSDENVALALRLCHDLSGVEGDVATATRASEVGWSANALVRITSVDKWVVKMPRTPNAQSVAKCRDEARQARWAGGRGLGPTVALVDEASGAFVMAWLDAQPLASDQVVQRMSDVLDLLRRFHEQDVPEWFPTFNFFDMAWADLSRARECSALTEEDMQLVEKVLRTAESIALPSERVTACHNDFWGTNILSDSEGKLWCVDFEVAGRGDPLWDIGYLAASHIDAGARDVARSYGLVNERDQLKVVAYCHATQAWLACWCATHSGAWKKHVPRYLDKVRASAASTW